MAQGGTVLVVDDDPRVVDGYAARLRDHYTVRTAHSGEEALEQLSEDIDVVLLDRRMPDLSGDEVLRRIRRQGLHCRVAMVTAVAPDIDIIELGFDEYLVKPVSREELLTTVEKLLARTTYDEQIQQYFALVSKRTVLEQELDGDELADNAQFAELTAEMERLERALEDTLDQLDDEDAIRLFDR